MGMIGFISTNKLMTSPHAVEILRAYNEILLRDGKVNKLKFYRDVILPKIPEYDQGSWYSFLKRQHAKLGSAAASLPVPTVNDIEKNTELDAMQDVIVANDEATQSGVKYALNIGAKFYKKLWKKYTETPDLLTEVERRILSDSLFKAMKAQDSRIHALGKVREDNREQYKFDRAFQSAAGEDF